MNKNSKSRKTRIVAAMICAAMMLPIAGQVAAANPTSISASQAAVNTYEQDKLIGEHLGWSGTSVSISNNTVSTASVDYVTGNLFLNTSLGVDYFDLAYNSQDSYVSELGAGFTSRYLQRIDIYGADGSFVPGENDVLVYKDEHGTRRYLDRHETETGEWYWGDSYEDGLRSWAQGYLFGSGDQYMIFGKRGELWQYNIRHLAYLETFRVLDWAGNGYSPLGIYGNVDGSPSREIHFTYTDRFANKACIAAAEDLYGGKVSFKYQGPAMTDYQSGNYGAHFEYSADFPGITKVIDTNGNTIEIKYITVNGINKVSFVKSTKADGTVLDQKQFAYGDGQTVIIDKDGTVSIKTY